MRRVNIYRCGCRELSFRGELNEETPAQLQQLCMDLEGADNLRNLRRDTVITLRWADIRICNCRIQWR